MLMGFALGEGLYRYTSEKIKEKKRVKTTVYTGRGTVNNREPFGLVCFVIYLGRVKREGGDSSCLKCR